MLLLLLSLLLLLVDAKKKRDELFESVDSGRDKRDAHHAETPRFEQLDAPTGKNIYVELGVIVDQVTNVNRWSRRSITHLWLVVVVFSDFRLVVG